MRKRKITVFVLFLMTLLVLAGCSKRAKQTDEITTGVDVARYQGTIDWSRMATSQVDFAMVRLGYRSAADGNIVEDPNARYNLQEAQKNEIMLGGYFFSTAVSEEEAIEEANWAADLIDQYSITYPIAYDCEGYNEPESRQYGLSKKERTDIALAFLKQIEKRGYEGMFYSSKNELEDDQGWLTSKIEKDYKIWVAQYPAVAYPATEKTTYSGKHHMWQYTTNGVVPGVSQNVDMNVAYFGYKEINDPISDIPPEEAEPDVEAMLNFQEVNETVTAKESTNLRSIPSQGEDSIVLYTLQNGEEATRIAVSDSGWSKVEFNGNIYYAVSSYLTTDMNYNAVPEFEEESEDDGVETRFVAVNEKVTAKIEVNLRTLPSVEHPDCKVVTLLKNGTVVTRTGVNDEVGWSRLEYNGQTVYCVSSMLKVVN
ncbi:MAG: glycoside hydrolase family 25 [Oscillospiraceae bacterium]|nr:glycoside hydrolase family 25 [Oscillospiraceae bacterium]